MIVSIRPRLFVPKVNNNDYGENEPLIPGYRCAGRHGQLGLATLLNVDGRRRHAMRSLGRDCGHNHNTVHAVIVVPPRQEWGRYEPNTKRNHNKKKHKSVVVDNLATNYHEAVI